MDFPQIKDPTFLMQFRLTAMEWPGSRRTLEHVSVFTLSDIYDFTPAYRGQPRSGCCRAFGSGTPVYSTGKLETAPEKRLITYVVTSKAKLDEDDEWWLKMVCTSHVFRQTDPMAELDPWFRFACTVSLDLTRDQRNRFLKGLERHTELERVHDHLSFWGVRFGDHDIEASWPWKK